MRFCEKHIVRQILTGTVLLAGLWLGGCDRKQQAGPPPAAAEVAVVTVQPQKVELTTPLPGRTAAQLFAEIRPQVNGLIQKRLFTEGTDVKAGDVLYQIDPAPYQAAYNYSLANLDAARKTLERTHAAQAASAAGVMRQEATLSLAKINLQRMEDLFKDRAVSASDLDRAVTDVDVAEATLRAAQAQVNSDAAAMAEAEALIKQAEAAIETARINLAYTQVTAPISGRIGRSNVTEGAIVTAYQAILATITSLDPIYVDVTQSTTELNRLRRSLESGNLRRNGTNENQVKILMEDGTEYSTAGILQFQDVTVDPSTGSVVLRIMVPNPNGVLLPGMFVRAMITEGTSEQAILVIQQGILRTPKGDPYALIVDGENKVQQRMLTIQRAIGNQWLISSGLNPGDRVIVEGTQKIRPGAVVQAFPFEAGRQENTPEKAAPPSAATNELEK